MCAGSKDMQARVWIPADGALAIRYLSKIGLLKTSGQSGISEGPMPELEGIPNRASQGLSGLTPAPGLLMGSGQHLPFLYRKHVLC